MDSCAMSWQLSQDLKRVETKANRVRVSRLHLIAVAQRTEQQLARLARSFLIWLCGIRLEFPVRHSLLLQSHSRAFSPTHQIFADTAKVKDAAVVHTDPFLGPFHFFDSLLHGSASACYEREWLAAASWEMASQV